MDIIDGLVAGSTRNTTTTILRLLRRRDWGHVLDAPAGSGARARLLFRNGYEVTALDTDAAAFKTPELSFVEGDLDTRLPFPDRTFDFVTCVDAIEQLAHPHHTFREFERVLKPGGELLLSVPNVSRCSMRTAYWLTGLHRPRSREAGHTGAAPAFPRLRATLQRAGLTVSVVTANRAKRAGLPALILYPFVALATRLSVRDRRLRAWMLGWPVVTGETLVLVAARNANG